MDMKELKEKVVAAATKALEDAIKPAIEMELEKQIEAKCDKFVEIALVKIAELIPGKFDDALLTQYAVKVKADVKALLLAEVEKISDKV